MIGEVLWYYAVEGERRGPVKEEEIPTIIRRGEIGPETLVWREGMEEWGTARSSLPGAMVPQSWVDGMSAPVPPPSESNWEQGSTSGGQGSYYHPTQFGDVISTVLGRYVAFEGRARRSEYWYWILFVVLVSIALAFVDGLMFGFDEEDIAVLGPLFSLGTFLPSLAVAFRRMHDLGRSAWWLLLGFIPVIGTLILIYWFAQRGDAHDNDYGPA